MNDSTGPFLTTPRAILMGLLGMGVLAGLGAYLGLSRAPTAPTTTTSAPGSSESTSSAAVAPTVDITAAKARASRSLATALEKARPGLVAKCGATLDSGKVSVQLNVTFDAAGKQLARGLVADRSVTNTSAVSCLSDNFPMLEIEAPGATVALETGFAFP